MTKRKNFHGGPNTLDYDHNNPEHAHIRANIMRRMVAGEIGAYMRETFGSSLKLQLQMSTSVRSYYHGAIYK